MSGLQKVNKDSPYAHKFADGTALYDVPKAASFTRSADTELLNPIVPFTSFGHVTDSEYATVLVVPTANNGADHFGSQQLTFMEDSGETRMVCTKPTQYVLYILSRF